VAMAMSDENGLDELCMMMLIIMGGGDVPRSR
jgi:hypothetical protein